MKNESRVMTSKGVNKSINSERNTGEKKHASQPHKHCSLQNLDFDIGLEEGLASFRDYPLQR